MFEKFLNKLCEMFLTQLKFPRKGAAMILLLFVSIAIVVNKYIFSYSLAPKGSLLLQFIYFLWMYSFVAIPIRAYNEYCDKQDAEKQEQENKKKSEEGGKKYFEIFELCTESEQDILAKFYINQTSTCYIDKNQVSTVKGMILKGINFLKNTCDYSLGINNCIITPQGMKIINQYFDKDKEKYFQFFATLDAKSLDFIEQFYLMHDTQLVPEKGNKRLATSVITEFHRSGFDDIYWDSYNGWVSISETYLAYISLYFEQKKS